MNNQLVFTSYNRLDYLSLAITSWNSVRNLKFWNSTFFIEPSEVENEVIDLALGLETTVTTVLNPVKLGVLVNPWNAINTAFETTDTDFVVISEDDVVVSQDVLEFFEWAGEEYSRASNVLCLNAFSTLGGPKSNQLMLEAKFSPLCWGVWRNRWEDILRDSWDKDYSTGNEDGSEAGWDWNINRILQDNNMAVVKPLQSRSDHIGEFNGTHMTPDLFDSSRGVDFKQVRGRQRYIEI